MLPSILIVQSPASGWLFPADHLVSAGFAVREAHDAEQAMRRFRHEAPDLVLLGLEGDGMNVLRGMKNMRGTVPVIVFSERTSVTDAVSAFKAGAWDYVTTPVANMDIFINSLRNCLDQSRLRRHIQETQQHLYMLVQNLPAIIFIINRHLEFEFLSQTTNQILGYTHQEILHSPKSFLRRIPSEDRRRFLDGLRRGFQAGRGQFRMEFRFRHKKGFQLFLQAHSIARAERGAAPPEYLEGMILDVTRNTYMENLFLQNEKLEILRGMTEEVAHDIRNPLVSLGGVARQLRARFPEAAETDVILEQCGRLERLLHRMNAYLEPLHTELKPCSVPAALAFALRLLADRLERKSIQVDISGDSAPVRADQEMLHRVFIHILGYGSAVLQQNGMLRIQNSQSGGLTHVTVTLHPADPGPARKNGRGLPFEDEEQNLSTCSRLVERMQGGLHVEHLRSTARITVSLPGFQQRANTPALV